MSDTQWIHEREALQYMSGRFYIYDRAGNVCPNPELDLRPWEDPLHAGIEDYRDAAEFEARVADKLAIWNSEGVVMECDMCEHREHCKRSKGTHYFCRWVFIRDARLAVEEEMD